MRALMRILVACIGIIALVLGVGFAWMFLYSRDLPDVRALAQFAPGSVTQVSDPCLRTTSVAIPFDSIGDNLRAALRAVEVREDDPGALVQTYRGFTGQTKLPRATLSLQISRTMFCSPSKSLNRELEELRTAAQLERRFSRRDLFTIFANRAWFGEGVLGVEAASQQFFQKDPVQLRIGEAALIAGLIRSPSRFSPTEHPDRALQRRNEVIDAMVQAGFISAEKGEASKARGIAPLRTD
jgi:penicillin-binding protein 1A